MITTILLLTGSAATALGQAEGGPQDRVAYQDIVTIDGTPQHDVVRPAAESAIALKFKLKDPWHFYADPATAPGGMDLKIKPQGEGITFGEPVFPPSTPYFDESSGQRLQAYGGEFVVYQPFTVDAYAADSAQIVIGIDGAICSESLCMRPAFEKLRVQVPVSPGAPMDSPAFQLPREGAGGLKTSQTIDSQQSLAAWVALPLALLAGLILNLMPCVWPVLPIIVMRLLEQSRHSRARSVVLGLAFCAGIVLFFVAIAAANIVLRVSFGTVFQWGDHFRNPVFLIGMVILMVVLGLFMFGLFGIGVPSSITGRAQGGKGFAGSVAMGFLAALLATPCSFAILTAAFAWAQTQPLALSTAAILLIGVGMAAPYLVLTAMPGLLQAIPKPGRWMELLKQGLGFVLLVIAVKLLSGLPDAQKVATLYFAVVVAFSIWMWGAWVSYETPPLKKWFVRSAAFGIALAAGVGLFRPEQKAIDWHAYDAARIERAVSEGRPALLEFMADWCLTCKVVEKTVYERQDIADLLKQKGVLAVRADTTLRDYPAAVDLKNVYHEPGVPVTILLLPDGEEPVRLHGVRIGEPLKEALEQLPDAKESERK
ncbi:MAG: thioredoxin family protein [Phycisphaerae bacterium]|nr:thioredoxin family protein [Phycisphaerae bacterium]